MHRFQSLVCAADKTTLCFVYGGKDIVLVSRAIHMDVLTRQTDKAFNLKTLME